MIKIYVHSSFNNTHVAIYFNDVMRYKASSGISEIKGAFKKNSPMALASLSKSIASFVDQAFQGKFPIVFFFSGSGKGKFFIIKSFAFSNVVSCFYSASFVFNGCRKKKRRRLLKSFGQMSEWFKVPVLKTGKNCILRRFESCFVRLF